LSAALCQERWHSTEAEDGTTQHEAIDGGKLRWLVQVAPGERKSVDLRYSVEIAKNYRY